MSGVLVFQDVVQLSEVQLRKKFCNEESHLPGGAIVTAHAAEALHQVEGAKVPPGGWVGRDSWFGSVFSAAEVKRCFNVHSMGNKTEHRLLSNDNNSQHVKSQIWC